MARGENSGKGFFVVPPNPVNPGRISEGVMDWGSRSEQKVFICEECGEPCESVEDTFDYSGTHCTNGNGGTHRTGEYSSSCCGADYLENVESET